MDSITVVDQSISALKPHLPVLQDPAARALYETIAAALQRRGQAHLLNGLGTQRANESEIKRALRQAVRDEPHLALSLNQAAVAARSSVQHHPIPAPARIPTQAPAAPAGYSDLPPATYSQPTASQEPIEPIEPIAIAEPAQPSVTVNRPDLIAAIDATPPAIRREILVGAARCVELVDANLPDDEVVKAVASASVRPDSAVNCLLVLTDRRLIFVAPRPQAVGFRLSALTKSQANLGYFFLEGDAGEYSVGLPTSQWSQQFEQYVFEASALAVLSAR
ncbi:hypothetical protein ACFFX1_14650 [Dactylosporangium sucinum]|uniref:Uncharacterized protein n=1 Tax=Dactylosporangium sucinum TaxID=1424081 RepID=A0A917U9S6_9ACTN|nr:hypothetical protein [Dactylosporangium sucinum]GGM69445.1 hypothetical protein GCM10007977_083980 [Dactylosporangium sucinum]